MQEEPILYLNGDGVLDAEGTCKVRPAGAARGDVFASAGRCRAQAQVPGGLRKAASRALVSGDTREADQQHVFPVQRRALLRA
jgi:hypothetical protein